MKTVLAAMMLLVSVGAIAEEGTTTLYGNSRYCVANVGGATAVCDSIHNGGKVTCDPHPSTRCNIPGVGPGSAGFRSNKKGLLRR